MIEIGSQYAAEAGAERIDSIAVRIGRLSCVHQDALRFSFQLVAEGTPLEGARLDIIEVPVAVYCSTCRREVELPGIQRFRCPDCGRPSGDVRRGRELEIESIAVLTAETP